jgi:hypothetical protein
VLGCRASRDAGPAPDHAGPDDPGAQTLLHRCDDLTAGERRELVDVPHVPVDGRLRDPEPSGDRDRGHRIRATLLEQSDGGIDDVLTSVHWLTNVVHRGPAN